MISPMLPHDRMPTAGGLYVQAVARALAEWGDLTVIAPNDPVNQPAPTKPGRPDSYVLAGQHDRRFVSRAARRAAQWLFGRLWPIDVSVPHLSYAVSLVRDPAARRALRGADLVDIQYSEFIRLAPLLRRLAPRARLVGTFHDVLSQRYERYAEAGEPSAPVAAWRRGAAIATRSERAAMRRLDVVAALSPKDAALLPGATVVLDPPLWDGGDAVRDRAPAPRLVFVGGMEREDNEDAVRALLREVWPVVYAARPDAVLRVIGRGARPDLAAELAAAPGVEAPGFVDDLAAEYARAWCAVIPLRLGAGVKFKTIEAVLAGVPVVTTPIGAEGIPASARFESVTDDLGALAAAALRVLDDAAAADERAAAVREWAKDTYSAPRFAGRLGAAYGLVDRS
jgi:glycosyltransferase involved in cell wall biosynthesis